MLQPSLVVASTGGSAVNTNNNHHHHNSMQQENTTSGYSDKKSSLSGIASKQNGSGRRSSSSPLKHVSNKRREEKQAYAALISRLPANAMSDLEKTYLNFSWNQYKPIEYVNIRNAILVKWYSDVTKYLTIESACKELQDQNESRLSDAAYEFLNRFGFINIGLIQSPSSTPSSQKTQNSSMTKGDDKTSYRRVIVIGAGMAGITAARKLTQLGYHVTILEARHRTGGRIYTDVNHKYTIDLGASIVTGTDANPICTVLTKQTNVIDLYNIGDHGALYDFNGQIIDTNLDNRVEQQFNEILNSACDLKREENAYKRKRYAQYPNQDMETFSLGDTLFKMIDENLRAIPERKLKELNRRILNWHVSNLEYGVGTNLKPCSLVHWDQDDQYDVSGKHKFVKQGYSSVINILSKNLDIKLGQIVDKINYDGENGIVISTKPFSNNHTNPILAHNDMYHIDDSDDLISSTSNESDGEESDDEKAPFETMDGTIVSEAQEYSCDAVLVTIPLGVLQKRTIQFQPPLPQWKDKAIDNLGFGLLNKLILTFPYVFWRKDMDYFGSLHEQSEKRGQHYLFWNMYSCLHQPVLVALFAGNAAHDIEDYDLESVLADTMSTLRRIFGEHIPDPVKYLKTNWCSDPFATGSYSYIKIGGTGEDMDTLASPVDSKVFFAGEATWRQHPSTVYGALLSGLREAGRIDYELTKKRDPSSIITNDTTAMLDNGTELSNPASEYSILNDSRKRKPSSSSPTENNTLEPENKKVKLDRGASKLLQLLEAANYATVSSPLKIPPPSNLAKQNHKKTPTANIPPPIPRPKPTMSNRIPRAPRKASPSPANTTTPLKRSSNINNNKNKNSQNPFHQIQQQSSMRNQLHQQAIAQQQQQQQQQSYQQYYPYVMSPHAYSTTAGVPQYFSYADQAYETMYAGHHPQEMYAMMPSDAYHPQHYQYYYYLDTSGNMRPYVYDDNSTVVNYSVDNEQTSEQLDPLLSQMQFGALPPDT